jgi:hypothetical protein
LDKIPMTLSVQLLSIEGVFSPCCQSVLRSGPADKRLRDKLKS